jgi:Arc/MetJ family transcription regulator
MATNLDIDQKLLAQAKRVGKHRTKKEAVNAALAEYVQRRNQLGIIELFGTVDYDDAYDYKAQRKKR